MLALRTYIHDVGPPYACIYTNRNVPPNKQINWKFEDVLLKRHFYQLDCMLNAAPEGQLWVNRGTDANRLTNLLTFMLNAILRAARKYVGCGNHQNSMYQGGMSEQRS